MTMTSTGATRPSGRRRGRRRVRVLVVLVVVAALVAAAWYWIPKLYDTAKTQFSSDTCSIGSYDLDPSQASVAAAMVGATTKFRVTLPFRASVLVLMAGLQESKLQNLAPGVGDRDSVGVLQQRPSQGWGRGKASTLTDVGEATREFLEALVKVPRWQTLPPAEAIQKVQISADGSAYAQHQSEATALATGLRGLVPAGVSCSFAKPSKVAPATTVAALARKELGITTPAAAGHAVRVPGAGWQTAAWFVANADRLGIEQVGYAAKTWTRSAGAWKPSSAPGSAVVATMATLAKS